MSSEKWDEMTLSERLAFNYKVSGAPMDKELATQARALEEDRDKWRKKDEEWGAWAAQVSEPAEELVHRIKDLTTERDAALAREEDARKCNRELAGKLSAALEQVRMLKGWYTVARQDRLQLMAQRDRLEHRIAELEAEAKRLSGGYSAVLENRSKLEEECDGLYARIAELEAQAKRATHQ